MLKSASQKSPHGNQDPGVAEGGGVTKAQTLETCTEVLICFMVQQRVLLHSFWTNEKLTALEYPAIPLSLRGGARLPALEGTPMKPGVGGATALFQAYSRVPLVC